MPHKTLKFKAKGQELWLEVKGQSYNSKRTTIILSHCFRYHFVLEIGLPLGYNTMLVCNTKYQFSKRSLETDVGIMQGVEGVSTRISHD